MSQAAGFWILECAGTLVASSAGKDEHRERDPGEDGVDRRWLTALPLQCTANGQEIGQLLIIQEEIPGHTNETIPNEKKKKQKTQP